MITSGRPFASFDALYLTGSLGAQGEKATLAEIHVFAYLACLLSVYDGKPSTAWRYDFSATEVTAPFSNDLLGASLALTDAGLLTKSSLVYSITDAGSSELKRWRGLRRFAERISYLEGALGAASTLPVNAVSQGLDHEPQILLANKLRSPRPLLDNAGRTTLHSHFRALRTALGDDISDLMVPAVIWITFLLEESAPEEVVERADGC